MPDLQTQFLAAVNARKSGDPARARELFARLLSEHPACHEAHYMLGMLSAESGALQQAESSLRRSIELDPGNPEYLFRLGTVLHHQHRWEDAVIALEQAEAESDESPPLLLALGKAHLLCVNLQKAEKAFRRLLELQPGHLEGLLGLMSTLVVRNRTDEAIALGRQAVERYPKNAEAHAKLAAIYERSNMLIEAGAEAEAALRITPNDSTALMVRGLLRHRENQFEEAVESFRAALAAHPPAAEANLIRRVMGLSLDRLKRYDEAFEAFSSSKKPLSEVSPETLSLVENMASYWAACKRDIKESTPLRWATPPEGERPAPIFFVGFPRSGTTLLEQMLGSHHHLVTSDEIQSLGRCTEELGTRAGSIALIPAMMETVSIPEIVRLRAGYWTDMERELGAAALAGKRLVDKHPLNTVNLYTARLMFPGSKVIVSLRDPRDVILSGFMHLASTPMAIVYYRSLEAAARLYVDVMTLWFHMRKTLGLEWMEVKYEELVEDPEGIARSVVAFLGEEWDDAILNYVSNTKSKKIRSASYQQVTEGIYKRSLGRWRAYEKHFGKALDILEPCARALGYEPR